MPCQQHLVEVQEQHDDPRVQLVLVGFSPADRLAAIARHLGWQGSVLGDPDRVLYRRFGIGRAPWWRVYTPGTLAMYARALLAGRRLSRSAEDTRQLGGDAILVDGTAVTLWRPRSPDDRPAVADVMSAAQAALDG